MAKQKTHIMDLDRAASGNAIFSVCGVFLYEPSLVDNANPTCQKCIQYSQARRSKGQLKTPKTLR